MAKKGRLWRDLEYPLVVVEFAHGMKAGRPVVRTWAADSAAHVLSAAQYHARKVGRDAPLTEREAFAELEEENRAVLVIDNHEDGVAAVRALAAEGLDREAKTLREALWDAEIFDEDEEV